MPGGVNSPARAFGGVGGEPIVVSRGEGAYLVGCGWKSLHRLHRVVGAADFRACASESG